ncbi:MAG: sigma-70 family RNA polymerase sigma factor [Planctomycetes bacterium]|nr:sigma-70 family RNA polymerase sigma factor [Planctomycetota bacterium]
MPPPDPADERALELGRLMEDALGSLHTHVRLGLGPFLRARESASDIVQSAVREVWKQRERLTFESEGAFRAYLFQVATRKILEKRRYYDAARRTSQREQRAETQSGIEAPARPPGDVLQSEEEFALLQAAFDELDEDDRTILSMCKVFDVPVAEAARQLGLAESTARYRLGSAAARLVAAMARRGLRPD